MRILMLDIGIGLHKVPAILNHEIDSSKGDGFALYILGNDYDSFVFGMQAVVHLGHDLEDGKDIESLLLLALLGGEVVIENGDVLMRKGMHLVMGEVDDNGYFIVAQKLKLLLKARNTLPACWLPRNSPSNSFTICSWLLLKGLG
jgi:hypothetical protein